TAGSDIHGVDPKLSALANNGGATDTLAPAGADSPVVDTGGDCAATDQRGTTRPAGKASDIRAGESAVTRTPPPPTNASPGGGTTTTPGGGTTPGTTTPPPDTTPPTVSVTGLASKVKLKAFLKGLSFTVTANEATSLSASLLGSISGGAHIAKSYNLVL